MRLATITLVSLLTVPGSAGMANEIDSQIRDAAARIDYGWLTAELGLIVAARETLQGRSSDPWAKYFHAYASYRAAQLTQARGSSGRAYLEDCETSAAAAAEVTATEVEASVLLAACAALAAAEEPLRSVLHQRRLRQALARAEALDPDNPRLRLVAYLYTSAHDADSQQALEAVLAAFRLHEDRHAYPEWGEAEALTLLGAIRLESGDLKGARDLLEEALLIAPDYAAAVQLRRRIHNLTATQ